MKHAVHAGIILVLGLCACTSQPKPGSPVPSKDGTLKNLISIVEIPVTDFPRAVTFYEAALGITIQEMEMDGVTMGILPSEEGTVNVVLAKGADYKPTTDGTVLYLQAGTDLQPMLDTITQHGGRVLVPKTPINPEMGFFALFIDTEGNKVGLHSAH